MNAVGIDISKGKSMVAALRPMGEVAMPPQEYLHTAVGLERMVEAISALGEDTRVIMEATGRYHEPVASTLHERGIYVSVLNPLLIRQSGGGSIRKVKSDKADALKIAKYGLDNWTELREYTPIDMIRQQLKLCSRQYNLAMKTAVSLENNLISLTDKAFPGVNELFSSPDRADGHQKWVDFLMSFWHCDCICRVSGEAFAERYHKWCKRKGYQFGYSNACAAQRLHEIIQTQIPLFPRLVQKAHIIGFRQFPLAVAENPSLDFELFYANIPRHTGKETVHGGKHDVDRAGAKFAADFRFPRERRFCGNRLVLRQKIVKGCYRADVLLYCGFTAFLNTERFRVKANLFAGHYVSVHHRPP